MIYIICVCVCVFLNPNYIYTLKLTNIPYYIALEFKLLVLMRVHGCKSITTPKICDIEEYEHLKICTEYILILIYFVIILAKLMFVKVYAINSTAQISCSSN